MKYLPVGAALAMFITPAYAQNADWQLDPLPTLQGEWEYFGPEENASWGGYAKMKIDGQTVTMIDPFHVDHYGSAWTKAPANVTIMKIEKWTQDTTTGADQLIIRGTCYDYSNSNGRPGSCWHVLTKRGPGSKNRASKEVSWTFAGFDRVREGPQARGER